MKHFKTGIEIRVGDIVDIGNWATGIVMCDFDNQEAIEDYKGLEKESFLSKGVMIFTEKAGDLYRVV